ncbi:MAG: hypothetical protein DWH96_09950 [Planctomycetota bacterium]|nr:MAG: hypothetical protein DWH96_09950 [Planctomycetota bacterium]
MYGFNAITALLAAMCVCAPFCNAAQSTSVPPPETRATLIVGVFDAPPFAEAITQPDGSKAWEGTSIRLLDSIATDLHLKLEYKVGTEREILDALTAGSIDVCASPLAPTVARMNHFNFSYAYTAIGIAAATRASSSVSSDFELMLAALAAPASSHLYLITTICIALFALLVWWVERHRGGHFAEHPWRGIGASLWWSVVTLATVGYGDKVPASFTGRLIASVWMLASLILTAVMTATIVGSITLNVAGHSKVRSAADLLHLRVATVQSSVASDWLTTLGVSFIQSPTLDGAITMLADKRVDAVLAPALQLAQAIRGHDDLALTTTMFAEEYMSFGISFKQDDAFLRQFNLALVNAIPRLEKHDSSSVATALDSASAIPPTAKDTP